MAKMGGARVFFTVLANAQVDNLIADSKSASTIMESVYLDSVESIVEGIDEMFNAWTSFSDAMINSAMDVEYAKIHFRKFFDEGIEASKEFEDQLTKTGLAFGESMLQSIESGATMMQLSPVLGGAGAGTAATQGAMLMGTVGMMDTTDAMKQIMQIQMQTNFMYNQAQSNVRDLMTEEEKRTVVLGNTVRFVDMLNEAENKTGATIQGITQSMSQYAASARLANMSLHEQVALSASLIEQGEEQGKSGRAIKMMLARLASNRSENNELLAEHGVLVTDEQGNMRGLMDIMGQLKNNTDAYGRSWDNLTTVERQNIAIAIAGSHHYVRFLKLMEGYNRTADIQAMVLDSSGSAMNEFANFTENAAFQLDRYTQAIEAQNARTGELLIPSRLAAAKAELVFAEARNKVLETFVGQRGAAWFEMANVGFQHASGLLQAIFTYRMLKVAMATYSIVAAQSTHQTTMTTKAQTEQIKANMMSAATRQKVGEAYAQTQNIMAVKQKFNYSELQLENAINNSIVERLKNEMRSHTQGLQYTAQDLKAKTHLKKADAEKLRQSYLIDDAETKIFTKRIQNLNGEYRARQGNIMQIQTELKHNFALSDADKQLMNMRLARMRAENVANRNDIAQMEFKIQLSRELAKLDTAIMNTEERKVMLDMIYNNMLKTQAELQANLNNGKAVSIRLDQTKSATLAVEAKMQNMGSKADIMAAKAQNQLNTVQSRGMVLMGRFTQVLFLASMVVSFFGDEATAAEASMYLMMAAMVPLTLSMMSYGAVATKAAIATSIATVGFALVAGAAAYAMVSMADGESEMEKEMRKMEEALKDSEKGLNDMNDTISEMEKESTANIIAIEKQMEDSVDNMNQSIEEFDNKRAEVFFGGRTGRMTSALFKEMKQVGVENLYYAPEISVIANNTFNGLTYTQATNEIADMVMERLNSLSAVSHNSMLS